MSKRSFEDMNEGTPGIDDARYGLAYRADPTDNGEGSSNAVAGPSNVDDDDESYAVTPEVAETLFREIHGRILNTMQPLYQLPADEDEVKVRRCLCICIVVRLLTDSTATGVLSQDDVHGSRR